MLFKIMFLLCLVAGTIKALPTEKLPNSIILSKLKALGFNIEDIYDYNAFILGIETVIEQAQEDTIYGIQSSVSLAEDFARLLKNIGDQQNLKAINDIESKNVQRIEALRHQAYLQEVDISSCCVLGIENMNRASLASVANITAKLGDIRQTFDNYSQLNFIAPANENLERTYSVRVRIYECPFSFEDFFPFYDCLNSALVLEDILILNQFISSLDSTLKAIENLVYEYSRAAVSFSSSNLLLYNATANDIFNNLVVPCAERGGMIINQLN